MKRPTTRARSLPKGEFAVAILVGVLSGIYIFDEPLRRWSANAQNPPLGQQVQQQQQQQQQQN